MGLLFALPFFITVVGSGYWPVADSASVSIGNAASQFAFFYLAVFSLYYMLSSIVSRNTAFWAALLMGLNPWFLNSVGQSGGKSLACVLCSAAFLTWAAKYKQSAILMVLAGGLYALSVSDHVFALTYLPILFLTYLYVNHDKDKHTVWLGSALFIAGLLLGGVFLFDGQSMSQAVGGSQVSFTEAVSLEQLPSLTYLHIMAAFWLLSAVLLFTAKSKEGHSGVAAVWSDPATRPYGFCLSLCFMYGLILMTIEGGMGWSVLAHTSLSVFGLPLACIGLAGILERCAFTEERYHRHAAALFLVSLTLVSYQSLQNALMNSGMGQWIVLTYWIACLILLQQFPAIKKAKVRCAAVIALIVLAGFFLTGHDNPVWKANAQSQLTQLTGQSYK